MDANNDLPFDSDALAAATPESKDNAFGVFDEKDFKQPSAFRRLFTTKGGALILVGGGLIGLAIGGGFILSSSTGNTVTEYALVTNVPGNTQITPADVVAINVPADAAANDHALTAEDIASGLMFTKVDLPAGTILTAGPVGPYTRILSEVPAGERLVSIKVDAANAAGGSIASGDLVDIIITTATTSTAGSLNGGGGQLAGADVLTNIKVLDVTVAPETISANSDPQTTGVDSPALKGGIPSIYKLVVTPEQARQLAIAASGNGSTIYLALVSSKEPVSLPATGESTPAVVESPSAVTDLASPEVAPVDVPSLAASSSPNPTVAALGQ